MSRASLCAVLLVACTVPPLSPEGFGCPCTAAYRCVTIEAREVCVPRLDASDANDDARESDGGTDPCTTGSPQILVAGLTQLWATPHTIRWSWGATALGAMPDDDLQEYTVYIGTDEASVAARTATAFGADINPELGGFLLRAMGLDQVLATTTDGLMPNTRYFARLVARDRYGQLSCTDVAQARTESEAGMEIVLFDAARPPPQVFPYDQATFGPDGVCLTFPMTAYENIGGVEQAVAISLSDGGFVSAYIDFDLSVEEPMAGQREAWAAALLATGPTASVARFSIEPLTWRAGRHRYEVPLSAFVSLTGAGALRPEQLREGLAEFRIGSQFLGGSRVCLASAHIRY